MEYVQNVKDFIENKKKLTGCFSDNKPLKYLQFINLWKEPILLQYNSLSRQYVEGLQQQTEFSPYSKINITKGIDLSCVL